MTFKQIMRFGACKKLGYNKSNRTAFFYTLVGDYINKMRQISILISINIKLLNRMYSQKKMEAKRRRQVKKGSLSLNVKF